MNAAYMNCFLEWFNMLFSMFTAESYSGTKSKERTT